MSLRHAALVQSALLGATLCLCVTMAPRASAQTLQTATNDQLVAELQRRLSAAPPPPGAVTISGFCAYDAQGNGSQYTLTLQAISSVGVEADVAVVVDNYTLCTADLTRFQKLGPQLQQAAEFSACSYDAQGNGSQYLLNRFFVTTAGQFTTLTTNVLDNYALCTPHELPQ